MSTLDDSTIASNNNEISDIAINHLSGSAPWMKFIAILGFIGSGFMIIGALMVIGQGAGTMPNAALIGVIYLVGGGAYGYVSVLLWQWANYISSFVLTRDPRRLEAAFAKQKTWWMVVGVLTIVGIVLGIVFAAVAPGMYNPDDFRRY
jgi:hypothetical protein